MPCAKACTYARMSVAGYPNEHHLQTAASLPEKLNASSGRYCNGAAQSQQAQELLDSGSDT